MNARTDLAALDAIEAAAPAAPRSQEAEQSVLGCILLDAGAIDRCADMLSEADFFDASHRLIWSAISGLNASKQHIDAITVYERLRDQKMADEAGGLQYLNALSQSVISSSGVRKYAEIVRDHATSRALAAVAAQAGAIAHEVGLPPAEKIDRAVGLFAALQEGVARQVPQSASELIVRQVDHWTNLLEGKHHAGIPTHIPALDRALNGGLREGKVYVLAARPSVGKSSLAQQILLNVCLKEGHAGLMLSLEMEAAECIDRASANIARVDYEHLQTGKIPDEAWADLTEAADRISQSKLFVDDQAALTLAQIRAKAVALRKEGLRVLVLDYLQLCDYGAAKGTSTNDALAVLSKGIKQMAKDLKLAVIVLSQLNREVEKRASPEPTLADLRDSGAIEQDADAVLMLWRVRQFEDRGILGLALPKNRQGKAGARMALEFQGRFQRWYESDADISTQQAKGRNAKEFE